MAGKDRCGMIRRGDGGVRKCKARQVRCGNVRTVVVGTGQARRDGARQARKCEVGPGVERMGKAGQVWQDWCVGEWSGGFGRGMEGAGEVS